MTHVIMSGPIPNDNWLHFYQQTQFSGAQEMLPSPVSEATTVTTTAAPAQLSPEGRVSKPMRRRSRASRRTPTTLLNTDTTNFRAMVQQFTGAPSAPDLFGPSRPVPVNPNGFMLTASHSVHHHQQLLYQQQHYPTTYTEGGDGGLFERLSNPTATATNDGGGVLMEHGGRFLPTTSSS
ncbi:unnamed protein product [Sphenostylis stenocarpa]|uniref:VQ domain-containing protein n=1 Tax=Sphenostylis stenocarpa TaxID=92480 RepID=A0AA86VS52_9FABA|nr:unnamed protein product [Sphenostylis stenocarpa]